MHGIVFASLHDYARAHLGPERAAAIFDRGFYSMSDAHPDEEFIRVLERTRDARRLEQDELLREFGSFTAEQTFARLYPDHFALAGDARTFLLTVEDRIHELVRATIPEARPPALHVDAAGDRALAITYTSHRRLCRLLEGLVVGTGRHYGELLEVDEVDCMNSGASACRFEVQFPNSPPPRLT
jgi:predicted hydrocarbon binding protein